MTGRTQVVAGAGWLIGELEMLVSRPLSFEPMFCESAERPPEDADWRYELEPDGFALSPGGPSGARSFGDANTKISPADFHVS